MKKIISATLLLVTLLFVFASCVPANNEKAAAKLEKKGYSVTSDTVSLPALIYAQTEQNPKVCLIATKADDGTSDYVYAFLFNDKEDAEAAEEYINTYAARKDANNAVKRSGKWVYFGTEQGMKDFG